jgi:hypothetical protein
LNIQSAFKSLSDAGRAFGTFTIKKNTANQKQRKKVPESAIETLEKGPPRSTFSLFDLFGSTSESKRETASITWPPAPPPPGKAPPEGVPTLVRWETNEDGSITGVVFGSSKIGDGSAITTSPIVKGEQKQYEIVTTVTGSLYFLS